MFKTVFNTLFIDIIISIMYNTPWVTDKEFIMEIKLCEHFNYKKLLRFTYPSMIMMIFTSIYSVVDGFFVSNFAGKEPFTAVNFIMPFLMITGAFGFMLGTGGSALVARTMGEGDDERANRYFSLFIYVTIFLSVIISILGIIFIRPIASVMGASGKLLDNCVTYGRIILAALPFFMLQVELQSFFITAEKPKLGLTMTVVSGVCNILLDALLVGIFPLGIIGAAIATGLSQAVGGIFPLFYFARKNSSRLALTKTNFDSSALLKASWNGSSELLNGISTSVVGMLYNIQLLKFAGQDGVAAYGILMYVGMIFNAIFIGYTIGSAPVISYHFGADNKDELKGLLKRSIIILGTSSIIMFVLCLVSGNGLSYLFAGYDKALFEMTKHGFFIYSFSFLFMGIAIFGSGFFTALNDGLVSAIIAFLRTFVFQIIFILIFPILWELDGIWFSIVAAEVAMVAVFGIFLVLNRKKYEYY